MVSSPTSEAREDNRRVGWAWLALCAALIAHVVDEAATGFLDVYNPTVLAIRGALPLLPLPVFRYDVWLAGLLGAIAVLLGLSVLVFQGTRWTRPAAHVFAGFMLVNAVGHTAASLLGRTVESVRFAGPMPGFYSSPLLAVASLYLLYRLRTATPLRAALPV